MAGPYTMSELTTPSSAHTGMQFAGGHVSLTDTMTTNSVVYLCRVPANCTILDWCLYLSDDDRLLGAANQRVELGTSASPSGLGFFSLSGSASSDPVIAKDGRHQPRGVEQLMPVRVSISEDVGNVDGAGRFVWLTARFGVATSASETAVVANFWCSYTLGGVTGRTTMR